ncbi:MAG: NAD(P)H-quinone oxidoreductase [Gemmatimonadota bacterium]|nr:NAD(P)H-quinone oxidoreductase [Gemmatimonadota bacterium]
MRAIVIARPGGPEVLEEQDRPLPEPGVGQIRVRVHTSALNRADLMQRQGSYPAPPGAPADIPGMEYAGEVDALGAGSTLWRLGDRVMGIVGGGAHAEFLVTHEREALPVPAGLSWENAAAIPEAFLTAYDALFTRLDVRLGERVLIHAVGSGVGTATLQLARLAGAIVIGTSRSADKLARARDLGLDHAIDAADGDWAATVEAAVGQNAVHAVVDLVGGNYLRGDLRVLAPRGRLAIVGLTGGRTAEMDMGVLLGKRLHVVGTVLRSRPIEEKIALAREFAGRGIPFFESGRLVPIVERVFSIGEIRAAHLLLESNSTFGKVVLRFD